MYTHDVTPKGGERRERGEEKDKMGRWIKRKGGKKEEKG